MWKSFTRKKNNHLKDDETLATMRQMKTIIRRKIHSFVSNINTDLIMIIEIIANDRLERAFGKILT